MYRIEQIISSLSYCKSAPVKSLSKGERVAKKAQNWLLGLSMLFFVVCLVLAIIHQHRPLSPPVKTFAVIIALLAQLFAILLLLPDIVIGLATLIMWRRHMLVSLIQEIDKDEKNATRLMAFHADELQYAKYWIETKIARNESRLKLFFGDKTAALALLGLSWPVVKELGGLSWLSTSLSHFLSAENIPDTIILLCLAILLGMSLGGVMMKNINEKYKYQVSLLELALKLKEMNA